MKDCILSKGNNCERLQCFQRTWIMKDCTFQRLVIVKGCDHCKGRHDEDILTLHHVGRYKGEKVSFEDIQAKSIWKIIYYSRRQQWKVVTQFLWKVVSLSPMKKKSLQAFKDHLSITKSLHKRNRQLSNQINQKIILPNQHSLNHHPPIYHTSFHLIITRQSSNQQSLIIPQIIQSKESIQSIDHSYKYQSFNNNPSIKCIHEGSRR